MKIKLLNAYEEEGSCTLRLTSDEWGKLLLKSGDSDFERLFKLVAFERVFMTDEMKDKLALNLMKMAAMLEDDSLPSSF